ncbi:RimK family alpha-L-glutamate ligase [Sporosarcina sp. HYO08]|uniref:ATP-grasp domain-containing protein n=1 Tax=Sporosarcina sp. HYO08 TaxID=1759557 RepID=UPI000796BBA1|nr:ATP-grasp domain-containing protein [Sporosarcina sp. HYO08]KXH87306.1 hypothetical protein AU377_01660 [Sporosarcina sp. HYO08]
MKGYVYYSSFEANRNGAFIIDLQKEASAIGIELTLLVDDEKPEADADFILYRDRNHERSAGWEDAGFRIFNRSEVNRVANHKLRTFEFATMLGIQAIPTKRVQEVTDIRTYPIVLKTVDGHGGNEVVRCESSHDAKVFLKEFSNRELIMQPFIQSGSTDVRVFMMGNEVLGAVKRIGNDSFKSNYTLGGTVEKYELVNWQVKEVTMITQVLKSDYIGIDFLLLPDGRWILNEIEDPVGARSMYATHDFSVARKLLNYINEEINMLVRM